MPNLNGIYVGNDLYTIPSGGTTLNKYTTTIAGNLNGYAILYRILLNSKGKCTVVYGTEGCVYSIADNRYAHLYCIQLKNNNFMCRHVKFIETGLESTNSYVLQIASASSIYFNTQTYFGELTVTYYNDTEIQ